MAITTPQVNTIADLQPIVIKRLAIANPLDASGLTVVANAAYTTDEIRKIIFQADYEIARMIVDNLEHPYRTFFAEEETDWLSHGALIPAHVTPHSKVTVKFGQTEYAGEWRPFARIQQIRNYASNTFFGDIFRLYSIFGGRIYFARTEVTGKIDVLRCRLDTTLTTLLTPLEYKWGVVARSILMAANVGFPADHRAYWANFAVSAEQAVRRADPSVSEPEELLLTGA